MYQTFHKMHHEFKYTITIAYTYCPIFEYAVCNWFPTSAALPILGKKMHFITVCMWLGIRLAETMEGHSGYEFPISISVLLGNFTKLNPLMNTSARYHDFHHTHNVGNYSSFYTIWDTVFNSNTEYYAYLEE